MNKPLFKNIVMILQNKEKGIGIPRKSQQHFKMGLRY